MRAVPNFDFIPDDNTSMKVFSVMLSKLWKNLVFVINGHIGFGDGTLSDNIDGTWISTTTPVSPNTDFTVNHNLGRLPVGYIVMSKDRAGDIYTGSVSATTTAITLRCTVASVVLKIFLV